MQESRATEDRITALRRAAMSEKDSRGGGRAFSRLETAATTFGGSADPEAASGARRQTVFHGVWGGDKIGRRGVKVESGADGVKAESAAASESGGSGPAGDGGAVHSAKEADSDEEPELTFADALAGESSRFRPIMLPLPDHDGGVPDVSDAALVGGNEGGPSLERLPPVGHPPATIISEASAQDARLAREVLLLQFPPTMPFYAQKGGAQSARVAPPTPAVQGRSAVKPEPGSADAGAGADAEAGEPSVAGAFDLARTRGKLEGRGVAPRSRPLHDPVPARLKDLPSGRLGKLLVFESGAVKLRLEGSGVLLDLAESVPVVYRSDVIAAAPTGGHAVAVARVARRLTVTPDLQALLEPAQAVTRWPKAGEREDSDADMDDGEDEAEKEEDDDSDDVVLVEEDEDDVKPEFVL